MKKLITMSIIGCIAATGMFADHHKGQKRMHDCNANKDMKECPGHSMSKEDHMKMMEEKHGYKIDCPGKSMGKKEHMKMMQEKHGYTKDGERQGPAKGCHHENDSVEDIKAIVKSKIANLEACLSKDVKSELINCVQAVKKQGRGEGKHGKRHGKFQKQKHQMQDNTKHYK